MITNIAVQKITTHRRQKFLVEIDADRLERLAAGFGLFNKSFLKSLDRAKEDLKKGKLKEIKTLREIKK